MENRIKKALESSFTQLVECMKENSAKTITRDMDLSCLIVVTLIRASMIEAWHTTKVYTHGNQERCTMGNGRKE
jgi:hypothetical protein